MISATDTPSAANSLNAAAPAIRIRGARVHNLRNIDVDLPRDALTVITGVSGSGKSSLAFDTLYAEGQRQYMESLSTYARQFLDQLPRPDVDWVEGLEPTLCIDQKPGSHSPRSTVGTITEIYDYLRLLFARAGTAHCPSCGAAIDCQSPEQIIDALADLGENTKLMILAPLVQGRRGVHREVFEEIAKAGLVRARVDGTVYPLEEVPELAPRKNHTIEAVVDRIVIRAGIEDRLAKSARLALKMSDGLLVAVTQAPAASTWDERFLSTRNACPTCDLSFPELEPRTFSFNSPYGACEQCEGTGHEERFDVQLVFPDFSQSPAAGALGAWSGASKTFRLRLDEIVDACYDAAGLQTDTPLAELPEYILARLLHGGNGELGLLDLLEAEWLQTRAKKRRETLANLRTVQTCSFCEGARLRPEPLAVTVAGKNIFATTTLPIRESLEHFDSIRLTGLAAEVAKPLLGEICKRLRFLTAVGLHYLSLDRAADTLSGGELQRVRLATSIGSGLVGVCYVLDEPSIGLHQRDNQRLIDSIRELQQAGNTVVIVEHDETVMRSADWVIDMGPGAGHQGGEILAVGTPQQIEENPKSITGGFLSGRTAATPVVAQREPDSERWLRLSGATLHNLRDVHLEIPLGLLVGIAGVSGSGKSSLIVDTLYPALARQLGQSAPRSGPFQKLTGWESLDKLIAIDQTPIGRSPRSCPATFTGVFDEIRKVFAATREAKQRGFTASRFSFNSAAGRCPQCTGQGQEKIEMNFLSDLYVTCGLCGGKRFNQQTLRVRYKHASISDVLQMTVDEAAEFFENFAKIDRYLSAMRSVGLGYLHLGQSSTTLSGGEAQRLKLATELARPASNSTLYLLDEPTTGLHFEDVARLTRVLHSLVDRGHTVLVIEHNLDVLRACDWLVDMGPDGGPQGGTIVAAGPPAALANHPESPTGRYLSDPH